MTAISVGPATRSVAACAHVASAIVNDSVPVFTNARRTADTTNATANTAGRALRRHATTLQVTPMTTTATRQVISRPRQSVSPTMAANISTAATAGQRAVRPLEAVVGAVMSVIRGVVMVVR